LLSVLTEIFPCAQLKRIKTNNGISNFIRK
jgi:hypothetical protein